MYIASSCENQWVCNTNLYTKIQSLSLTLVSRKDTSLNSSIVNFMESDLEFRCSTNFVSSSMNVAR